jgi:hypothetical protein
VLTVRETSSRENSRLLEVPAGVRWIRLAENQASGWEYRIVPSTTWQAVQRAPDASMLIENTTFGQATSIEMRYHPPLRSLGFAISAFSLGLLVIGGTIVLARRPTPSSVKEA